MSKDIVEVLNPNSTDYLASTLQGLAGAVPLAGGAISEIIGSVIPRQRLDRVVSFVQALNERVSGLDEKIATLKDDEQFCELLYEATRQAAYSTSNERREYLASIVANGIEEDETKLIESRKLLDVLNDLNDIEVLWLKYFENPPTLGGENPFFEKHKDIFSPVGAHMGSPRSEHQREALQESYVHRLHQHLLVDENPNMRQRFAVESRQIDISSFRITSFGSLLLRHIGISKEER